MTNCLYCNEETKNPKFCNLSCGAKHQQAQVPKFSILAWCERCNKTFKRNPQKRFCSKSCSASANNALFVKRGKNAGSKRKIVQCGNCNSDLPATARVYCNNTCRGEIEFKNKIDAWLSGAWNATTKQGLAIPVKKYLIKQAEYKCSSCSWNEINPVTGRCPLEVDHIDGDCYNNKAENLQVVCPNCHALTPTYRALNKNGKRKYRTSKED